MMLFPNRSFSYPGHVFKPRLLGENSSVQATSFVFLSLSTSQQCISSRSRSLPSSLPLSLSQPYQLGAKVATLGPFIAVTKSEKSLLYVKFFRSFEMNSNPSVVWDPPLIPSVIWSVFSAPLPRDKVALATTGQLFI